MEKLRTSNSAEQPAADTGSDAGVEASQKAHGSELPALPSEAAAPAGEPASSEASAQNEPVEPKQEAAL